MDSGVTLPDQEVRVVLNGEKAQRRGGWPWSLRGRSPYSKGQVRVWRIAENLSPLPLGPFYIPLDMNFLLLNLSYDQRPFWLGGLSMLPAWWRVFDPY